MSPPSNFVRWYDRQPKLSQACKLLFAFPDEIKSVISEAILIIANQEFRQKEQREQMRSLGREKILGLYKSKNRRREYDINPLLHQAMNYLYLLSEEKRDFMAEHVLTMVSYIQDYLQACQVTENKPSLENVTLITDLYVKSGDKAVKTFLKQLRFEFCEKLHEGKKPAASSLLNGSESIRQVEGSGMRVKHFD